MSFEIIEHNVLSLLKADAARFILKSENFAV